MRRFMAVVLAALLSFAAPAFAQTDNSQNNNFIPCQSSTDNQAQAAYAQAPNNDTSPLLICSGIAIIGTGLIVFLLTHRHNNEFNPVSP